MWSVLTKAKSTKGHRKRLEVMLYLLFHGDGFTGIYIWSYLPNCIHYIYAVFCIQYVKEKKNVIEVNQELHLLKLEDNYFKMLWSGISETQRILWSSS